ncbi:hypothetical protein GUJ93_ZPchr0009g1991 [Zizania palustris]|uniref:Uncharacterized protein n=1 Tax=Zizania palustris TaxID=103762 RepID=A0A8J5RMK3_ZIZPA|nr:hypothetical protein GUJ93_ZPchr0009g1991 [Zizania palustris]
MRPSAASSAEACRSLPPPEPAAPSAGARLRLRLQAPAALRVDRRELRRLFSHGIPLYMLSSLFFVLVCYSAASPSADAGVCALHSSVRLCALGSSVLLSVPHFRLMIMVDLVAMLLSN